MSFVAVILCDSESPDWPVAGLRVLDRLVVVAYRAGAAAVTVVTGKPLPNLKRASALGIKVTASPVTPDSAGPVLLLSHNLLVQTNDLKRLVARKGRLVDREGNPLPAGFVTGLSGRALDEELSGLPIVPADGVVARVTDERSAAAASRILWSSLASPEDGVVDKYFNRPVGRWLSKLLVHTSISPNQVSIAATLLGLVSAVFFAQGGYRAAVWGAILLQISAIVDCVDGELARVLFKESAIGKWLDIVGDQVVHISVFAGIGIGLYRTMTDGPMLALAASAVIGVVISFALVLYGRTQLESRRNARLQKLIDATTNRDFSVLLLMLAVLGKLPWFLWLTAVGVHVFWLSALSVQLWSAAELNRDPGT